MDPQFPGAYWSYAILDSRKSDLSSTIKNYK